MVEIRLFKMCALEVVPIEESRVDAVSISILKPEELFARVRISH